MALIKAGLSSTTADMYYLVIAEGEYSEYPRCGFETDELPCWSLGILWKLLPQYIEGYGLETYRNGWNKEYVRYSNEDSSLHYCCSDYQIESVAKMALWCLSNGYIKK